MELKELGKFFFERIFSKDSFAVFWIETILKNLQNHLEPEEFTKPIVSVLIVWRSCLGPVQLGPRCPVDRSMDHLFIKSCLLSFFSISNWQFVFQLFSLKPFHLFFADLSFRFLSLIFLRILRTLFSGDLFDYSRQLWSIKWAFY